MPPKRPFKKLVQFAVPELMDNIVSKDITCYWELDMLIRNVEAAAQRAQTQTAQTTATRTFSDTAELFCQHLTRLYPQAHIGAIMSYLTSRHATSPERTLAEIVTSSCGATLVIPELKKITLTPLLSSDPSTSSSSSGDESA